jgi:hypothetical protein
MLLFMCFFLIFPCFVWLYCLQHADVFLFFWVWGLGYGRKQDVELMHMRYALESALLALGAMERCVTDERESHHQLALCHLKDLQNHLEAINNIARKVNCSC